MRKIDAILERTTPTFFKTAILTSALMGLIFTTQAQENYTASISGDYCELSSQNDVTPVEVTPTRISKEALKTNLKDLYAEQVTLTHSLIQNILDDSPIAEVTKLSLLQNQENIANSLAPFYGKEATGMLTALLYQHVVLTIDMVTAVRDGDNAGIDEAVDSWKDNGKQIAAFLNQTNPSLKLIESKQMVMNYLKSTVSMGEAMYKNNAAADMKAYNKALSANMAINARVTSSLINNYPDKFGSDETTPMVTQK